MQELLPLAVSSPSVAVSVLALLVSVAYLLHKASLLSQNSDTQLLSRKKGSGKDEARPSAAAKTIQSTVSKESDFPGNWWTGKDIFDLERRAIFSKTWLYVSHRSRFTKPGDYHSFQLAGFPIFLILGKDGIVRAFHNVCRHRAYTITRKESGSTTVLGCRYHGWSYNTRGQLINAPHFQNVPGFDKSQNGLFEIHTRTTQHGLIFINLDANPTVPEVDSTYTDVFASRQGLLLNSTWVAGWTFEGAFNWKLADNSFDMHVLQDHIPRSTLASVFSLLTDKNAKRGPSSLSLFPTASLHTIPATGLWYSLCFFPSSESRTLIRCDLYSRRPTIDATSKLVSEKLVEILRKRIENVENDFKSHYQESGAIDMTFSSLDENSKDAQYNILMHLKTHLKLEKTMGTEVFPALRRSMTSSKYAKADALCKELECLSKGSFTMNSAAGSQGKDVLAW